MEVLLECPINDPCARVAPRMPPIKRRPDAEREHAAHLRRSERQWNRWSDWYRLSEHDFEPIRANLIDAMAIASGDSVVEIGCGPGVNFSLLVEAVGDEGRVVAIDYSPAMVERAVRRIDANGWHNIEVIRADATTARFDDTFDAALATLSLSIMPDVERTIQNVYEALDPGGEFGVLDVREFPAWPAAMVNPVWRRFLRWYANWNPSADVPATLTTVFDEVEPLGSHMLGAVYTMKGVRSSGG